MNQDIARFLKRHTEALVKDVGLERACQASDKSKATLGRYYSMHEEHAQRFMPIDSVVHLERVASYPHVTSAMAELTGLTTSFNRNDGPAEMEVGRVNSDIAATSRRFAMLMNAYANAIADKVITRAEANEMLAETMELQRILVDMKMHLEAEGNG
ncbi:hypothetical protein MWU52_08130 [Jannaschia sp. S6380]|uniref:hypothetical protein n=1 Tax=Jannaschia sp. S6380 TaxID=2926408 RepID=UPI001FF6DED6|nr:hypothetical protein [Jannaschia sp. S6380]MCK0167510.1 hypothetical protein [Jannaschia sp. S6380]